MARLLADENLHPIGPDRLIEQVKDVALGGKGVEQRPQLVGIGGELAEAGLELSGIALINCHRD